MGSGAGLLNKRFIWSLHRIRGCRVCGGRKSTILRFNGKLWLPESVAEEVVFRAVHGVGDDVVLAAGDNGYLYKRSVSGWSLVSGPSEIQFTGIWCYSADRTYLIALDGSLHLWDGAQMHEIDRGTNNELRYIWGINSSQLALAGENGTMLVWSDSGPTPTPPPSWTPTSTPIRPTNTPKPPSTPSPTPTQTPAVCPETGVSILMPSHFFQQEDSCRVWVEVCNSQTQSLEGYPLFVILDALGTTFFLPAFTEEVSNYLEMHPAFEPGTTIFDVIPEFTWPPGQAPVEGLVWYAAMTDPDVTEIFGSWSSWPFGWD